jgi:SAM-dependent methyltransferase
LPRPKKTRRNVDPFIASHATEERTLDIGCSRSPYRQHFPSRVGLDLRRGKHVDVVGDVTALPIASQSFGHILMAEVLEHVLDPQAGVREVWRVLRPGGRVTLCVPFVYPIHDSPHDYQRWTHHGLRALFERAGFEVEEMRPDHGTMETISLLLHRVALQTTRSRWSLRRWVLMGLSALVGLFRDMPLSEFGDTKGRHPEEAILSMRYLVRLRRPEASPR